MKGIWKSKKITQSFNALFAKYPMKIYKAIYDMGRQLFAPEWKS